MIAAAIAVALLVQVGAAGGEPPGEPVAAPAVTVALGTTNLVLGVDQDTELRVELGPDVETRDPPRVLASTGHIDDLVRTGPRSFVGRYVLPAERFPQAVILVAEVPGALRRRGLLVVPLRAAAAPAFRTDPGASVTLRIGEKEFGPQRAPRDGNVRIPVVVPPGVTFGLARSTNEFGETTEQAIDLKIPPFRRLLVVAPETIRAGSVEEIAVYAVDAAGMPVDSAQVLVTSPTGKAQPLGGRTGEARFLVRAPPLVAAGALHLKAAMRNDRDVVLPVDIPVVAGQPAHLVLRPDRGRLALGSTMQVFLAAQDQFGNVTDAGRAAVLADGVPVATRPMDDGRVVATVPAPTSARRDYLEIEAALGPTYTAQRMPLVSPPGPASNVRSPRYPRFTLTPRLGAVWNFHQSPGAALQLEALGRGQGWPEALLIGMGVGLLATDVDVADVVGYSHVDVREIPILALVRYQERITERLILAASGGAGVSYAEGRVQSYGREIRGQTLAPALEGGAEASFRLLTGQAVLGARYLMVNIGKLSSGDELVGNSAGLIMDVGYRVAW
jgi:hypothetical protein